MVFINRLSNLSMYDCIRFVSILVFVFLFGCNSDVKKNALMTNLTPDEMSKNQFNKDIIPILEKRCGVSCHAVASDSYDEFMKDKIHKISLYFPFDAEIGKVPEEYYGRVYETVIGNHRIDYEAEGRFSHLVREPLAEDFGGLPHKGLDVFYSVEDDDYKKMVDWVDVEVASKPSGVKSLPTHIAYFKDNVLGMMERNGCFVSSCHGNQVFNDLKLTPPLPTDDIGHASAIDNGFSKEMVLANRKSVMGAVAQFINFNGDLKQSRLILKNLPIKEGGIHQRGGNIQFFESMDDQDVQILLEWFRLEKKALLSHVKSEAKPVTEVGVIKGIVFVRGPKHTPRTFFEFDRFYPGSDVYLLRLGEGESLKNATNPAINLTRSLLSGQSVEIQSVDVRYDAKRIIFSMRKTKNEGFRIYELTLNDQLDGVSGDIRQISFAPARLQDGTLVHHIDPIYIPGPEDKEGHHLDDVAIAFASNEAGHYAVSDMYGVLGEVDFGEKQYIDDRNRPEVAGTFTGKRLYFVSGDLKGEWRRIKEHRLINGVGSGARFILDKPLKTALDRNTSYVIEKNNGVLKSSFDIWRFVPATGHESINEEERYKKTLRQMTFSHAQERAVTTRSTGEVMFTSVRNLGYQGDKPVFNGAVYRVQAGGFDYHIQGGNRSGYPLFSDSREMGSGLEVRQVHDPRNFWRGGSLVLVDHGFGVNVESDNPADNTPYSFVRDNSDINFSSPPRFIPAMAYFFPENGANAVTHTGFSPGGSVREPYPLYDGSVLVSFTPRSVNHLDENDDPDWDVYQFKFEKSPHSESGERVGSFSKIRIAAASSEMAEYSAKPLMVRLKEKAHRPIHHQKFGSISSVTDPEEEYGVLRYPIDVPGEIECYDYPLLVSFLTNFQPTEAKDFHLEQGNPNGKRTPKDQVFKYVRIIMQSPVDKHAMEFIDQETPNNDPFATSVSLGVHNKRVIVAEVPVEDDGSFYVEVPTQVPLIVQGLNEDKMAMHSMNRWFYLQPGEKLTFSIPRSIFPLRCSGCHGSLTGDVAEGVGPVDLYSASSAVMATWNNVEGVRRKPFGYGKKKSDYLAVDYRKDVQPIFDRHCVSCHSGKKSNSKLDLRDIKTKHYNRSYENLHALREEESGNHASKKYINEREALSAESPLIRMLVNDKGVAHMKGDSLTPDEMLTLIRWVDLGATFKGGVVND